MPKLAKKAICYGRTDGRTDPNYRVASLLKRMTTSISSDAQKNMDGKMYKVI